MINELEYLESLYRYSEKFSSPLSPLCYDLEKFTKENVSMPIMLSGPTVAGFLKFLIQLKGAQRVLEFGCYTGYSALAMAEALPAAGEIITLDIDETSATIARKFWGQSENGKKITSLMGDAKETAPKLSGTFDFIFIDADKPSYVQYLEIGLEKLSPQGLIVADNCLYSGEVLNPAVASANGKAIASFNDRIKSDKYLRHILLPLRDGLHLIQKI